MENSLKSKIAGFLQWYQDLYGGEWYIETPNPAAAEKRPGQTAALGNSMLQQFHRAIENCQNCPLGRTRTKFVFGTGHENAGIMFIGEAPGQDEDLQGIPFVGRAGQLLNKLLANVQLKREEVYIANILKCRPPNNRDPQPEEVEQCIPYLQRQIEMVQPKLLVALGRVAAQNLLSTTESLTNMRKRVWSYREIPLIVTYHPAFVLRYNDKFDSAMEDMRFILEHYQKLPEEERAKKDENS